MESFKSHPFWRLAGIFLLVFGCLLLATAIIWRYASQQDQTIAQQQFNKEVDELVSVLNQHMQSYEVILRAASAFFSASDHVTRAEWREFTSRLRLDTTHPGLQGIGFTPRVPTSDILAHVEQTRAEGFPLYTIQPLSPDAEHEYYPIHYLEPAGWDNLRVLGFDLASEPTRLAAMKQAQRERRPIMSAPVTLVQLTAESPEPGVTLFWPIHDKSVLSSTQESHFLGFVYSAIRIPELINSALLSRLERLALTLKDVQAKDGKLFYSTTGERLPQYMAMRQLNFAGRTWQLEFSSTPAFEKQVYNNSALLIVLIGTGLSGLIALAVVVYFHQRFRMQQQRDILTQQLQQREERFRTLLDGAPNAMLMVDSQGSIEWINPQAEALFGYSRDELLNQSVELLLPERYRTQHSSWRHAFQQAPSPRQMGSGRELFARRKDGSEVPVEIGLSPVQTEYGVKTIGSIIDLSARRHAEERAKMLVEAAPNAIVLVNADGEIELINSQSEQLFGYTRSELIGEKVEMLIPEQMRPNHPTLRESYHEAPTQRQMGGNRELFARHKSGRSIPVEVGLAPIIAGGRRLIQAAVIDITARKAAEHKLREQAEQLALANRYKSEFLANMSHELRTPLNSILILSEQLKLNADGNLSNKQTDHADIINRSGSDLLSLINDILDLSKIEAGRMTLIMENVDVREMVAKLESTFQAMADAKSIQLRSEIHDDVPSIINTDGQRLQQIIRNLLSNALKFTEQGQIVVEIKVVETDIIATPDHRALCIAVRDTGIGIAPEQQETIFQAFRQADGSTSRRFGGTGLGLTISRQLAELLGGEILLESRVGGGSTFRLFIPLSDAKKTTTTTEVKISGPKANAPSILVVEDDPGFSQVLSDTANQYGFTCYATSSGVQAIKLLQEHRFEGIVLDLLLPDISGWQVLKEVRANPETQHLPVHIVTCVQGPKTWQDQQLHYLVKPVRNDDLQRLLKTILLDNVASKNVLLVEDNATEREYYAQLLQQLGLSVVTCADAESALLAYRQERFACLIVDLELPDMSGLELLQKLQDERPLTDTRVVIHTGLDLSEQESRQIQQLHACLVAKNSSSDGALLDAVHPFLSGVVPEPKLDPPAAIMPLLQGARVLLVDDDVRNIYAMSALLEKFQLQVVVARNGQEAVHTLAKDRAFDLILMDMAMPVMDGYTATRILKQENSLAVPIVAVTAHAMKGDREKCLASGADDYLAKPVDEASMQQMLARWLKRVQGV